MENFTPLASTAGGLLIGLSAALVLLVHGRIAGISGILGGLLMPQRDRLPFQIAFLVGLLATGAIGLTMQPEAFAFGIERSTAALVVAGLLVGFGTQLGRGCTSGHGVCGIGRGSKRSLTATATFMATGALTVALIRIALGGAV